MKQGRVFFVAALAVASAMSAQRPVQGGSGRGPAVVVGGGNQGGIVAVWPRPQMLIAGAPFSGVEIRQMQQRLANGNQIQRQEQTKIYRDGKGRVRMEITQPSQSKDKTRTLIEIFDPVAGFAYMVEPSKLTARRLPWPPPAPQGRPQRKAEAGQTREEDLGTKEINGIAATGKRTTRTIPAGAIGNREPIRIVRETWTSTVLNVPVLIETSDPRYGNSTMQLTQIKLGEPGPALFQVPMDYKVITRESGVVGSVRQ